MIRIFLHAFLSFVLLIFTNPVYSSDFSSKSIEKYTLKIAMKFSKTYCNTTQFGISKDGALQFAIGETNKEFLSNKLNKFVDYEILNKNIILNIENECHIYDFPVDELENLAFK